ncbi:MAG: phosphoribosyltransferase [Muribaculaceae bacterium]|nr:phosphoribosyltransferase [Muribaculaceae bacterium]
MERLYSYDELASVLGCTRTAIAKKVKPDENNPSVERYKNRYKVVINEGKKCILIDDEGLEQEKSKSRGFKNVSQNSVETSETQSSNDVHPIAPIQKIETVSDVTERYMDKFLTLQQHMYNQIQDRDKQILLLSVNEKQKEDVYLQTEAENKKIKEQYNVMEKKYNVAMNVIKGFVTLVLICITGFITFNLGSKTVSQPVANGSETVTNVQEQVTQPVKPVQRKR